MDRTCTLGMYDGDSDEEDEDESEGDDYVSSTMRQKRREKVGRRVQWAHENRWDALRRAGGALSSFR